MTTQQLRERTHKVKVTAIKEDGTTITSGWFDNINMGESFAAAKTASGLIVVKQYMEA